MKEISPTSLKIYKSSFSKDKTNEIAQRAVIVNGIYNSTRNYEAVNLDQNQWSYEIDAGDIHDQARSGRCWLYAALVLAEVKMAKKLKISSLKLSKSYLNFYDKLEMCNSFYQSIIDSRNEELFSKKVQNILSTKQYDGGYWHEAANLIEKYGVVPESAMTETRDTKLSSSLNSILDEKLSNDAKKIRDSKNPQELKEQLLDEVYKILAISYGLPPEKFVFDFSPEKNDKKSKNKDEKEKKKEDKNKKNLKTIHTTPLDFWKKYGFEINDFACLSFMLDYKKSNWETFYEEDGVDSMYDKKYQFATTKMSNEIKQSIIKQLKNGEPVWFSWDVEKQFSGKLGILDSELWKYNDLYDLKLNLDKESRGFYHDISNSLHATAIVGYREEKGKITHWKVKNSWGKDHGQSGFISMNDNYLDNYILDAVVRKKYLPENVQDIFNTKPTVIRYWD